METKDKHYGLLKVICTLASCLIIMPATHFISVANAGFINMGTLDVAPVNQSGKSADWFVQYLQPGQKHQEQIRVSNFGDKTKNLEIYATDAAADDNGNFFAKSPFEKSDDVAGWIKLPVEKLSLAPGESKIMSVNFSVPANAGVGLHTGAVIVREIHAAENGNISLEKGVRVYLNVTGPIVSSFKNTDYSLSQSGSRISLDILTQNTGTTDSIQEFTLRTETLYGEIIDSVKSTARIKPGITGKTALVLPKPAFGIYRLSISSPSGATDIGTFFFLPLWALLLILALPLIAARKSLKTLKIETSGFKINTLANRRVGAYFAILALMAGFTYCITNFDASTGEARSIKPTVAYSYTFEVKWGNFRGYPVPAAYQKNWNGKLTFNNAIVSISEYLHFENEDKAEITGNNSALLFRNTTGPDNDGIMLHVEPTTDQIPTVTYENFDTGEKYTFPITNYLYAPGIYPYRQYALSFKTGLGAEHVLSTLAEELEGTPEIEATPTVGAIIPELKNLFVEDLPATPEALADFVLSSDYVSKIVTERKTALVETDPILIMALAATPDILEDITATPDLNFIFIPNDHITFPSQEFSFGETRISTENIGAMIFVQNKGTPWNTYVGTTDFTSLSSRAIIPASSLTIIPGEPIILKQDGAKIQTGNPRTFVGTADKSVLVNVEPGAETEQIFILNPILQIRVPAGTLPGRYRGTLTITSL